MRKDPKVFIDHILDCAKEDILDLKKKMLGVKKDFKTTLVMGISEWLKEYQLISDIWSGKFPEHRKKVSLSILEKVFMAMLVFVRSLSLVHFKEFFSSYKIRSEISEFYVLAWLAMLLWLLWHPLSSTVLLLVIVAYRLIDGLNYRLCIVFVDRYTPSWGLRSLNRSLLILMFNYCEIIIGFAILYLATHSIGYSNSNIITTPIEALYFSTMTITTSSYGDIRLISTVGQKLALLEPLLGFVLVVLVIGVFLTGVKDIKEKTDED